MRFHGDIWTVKIGTVKFWSVEIELGLGLVIVEIELGLGLVMTVQIMTVQISTGNRIPYLYSNDGKGTAPIGAVRMTDGHIAIGGNKHGHIDGQHLCDVDCGPDECLQIPGEPVTCYSSEQHRCSEHLRQTGRQQKQVVDHRHHLHKM